MTMSGPLLRIVFCSFILCFISSSLFILKYVFTYTDPSASQQVEVLRKITPSFFGNGVIGKRKGTVIGDCLVSNQNGRSTTQRRKSSDPVEFLQLQNKDDLLLYLYDRLLTSTSWDPNPQNLAEFRGKLLSHTKMTFQEDFVLTKRNARAGDILPYYVIKSEPNQTAEFYNLSQRFMAANVPPVSPLSGKRFKRCSVVGNSGVLFNSKCGKEIDQSDYVIRSNLPPIRPHAADAGWKTNLTTMNPSVVQRRFKNLWTKKDTISFVEAIGDYNGVLWLPCVASAAMVGLCFKAKYTLDNYGVRNPESIIANPFHFLAVSDFWKDFNLTRQQTTGFYMTQLSDDVRGDTPVRFLALSLQGARQGDGQGEESQVSLLRHSQVKFGTFDQR